MGKGSSRERWSVDNILHAIAKMENTFIFVDPKKIKVDICDLYLESAGMNLKTRENRFMIMDDEKRYFGHVYVKLHEDEAFRQWYEIEKDKFIQESIEKGGKFPSMQEDIEIEREELDEALREDLKILNLIGVSSKKYLMYKLLREGYKRETIKEMFRYRNKETISLARISQIYTEMEEELRIYKNNLI